MLDGVLRWLVGVTGLEPKLLTLTAILIVYAASVYLSAKEKAGVAAPAQPVELGEFAPALARVERGLETVAKYLINLENHPQNQPHEHVSACPFLPPRGAGSPPLSHHRPDNGSSIAPEGHEEREEEAYFPVPVVARAQPGFFRLPLPVIQRESTEIHDLPVPVLESPEIQPEPEPLQVQPSAVVRETLERMSRKAGRIP